VIEMFIMFDMVKRFRHIGAYVEDTWNVLTHFRPKL